MVPRGDSLDQGTEKSSGKADFGFSSAQSERTGLDGNTSFVSGGARDEVGTVTRLYSVKPVILFQPAVNGHSPRSHHVLSKNDYRHKP